MRFSIEGKTGFGDGGITHKEFLPVDLGAVWRGTTATKMCTEVIPSVVDEAPVEVPEYSEAVDKEK